MRGLEQHIETEGTIQWKSFYLQRMQRLVALRTCMDNMAMADPRATQLVRRAIFSTYQDCRDQGVGQLALQALQPQEPTPEQR